MNIRFIYILKTTYYYHAFLLFIYFSYLYFSSATFASGSLSYSLFFPRPSAFRLADKHVWEREVTHDSEVCNFTRNMVTFTIF